MKILVTGSTGLVGSALVPRLTEKGNQVVRLVRSQPKSPDEIYWDPENGILDAHALTGVNAAVHLAGENIADERWTDEKKRRIRESRAKGTRLLSEKLSRLEPKPRVLVSASAIGFYGDRAAEILREDSSTGNGFLAEVARAWEAATAPASDSGIRVVLLRIGVILSPRAGALAKMLTPFKLGLGGRVGSGEQFMSWIALDDVVGIIEHALANESLKGPVNTVAPNPVTSLEFTKTLGRVLSRPTIFPMPAFALRIAFGEMADETLLSSTRVEPLRLNGSGYSFKYPKLEGALEHLLKDN